MPRSLGFVKQSASEQAEGHRQHERELAMNHKRRRPKNRRAGCLMCKPHKMNGETKRIKIRGLKVACKLSDLSGE